MIKLLFSTALAAQLPITDPIMILLGSTFPLGLIRRRAVIEPTSLEELRKRLQTEGFVSFWGHENTLVAAQALLGIDPRPDKERPALILNPEALPSLNGRSFEEVWVLSPDYLPEFRPKTGEEVNPAVITSWQVLRIRFS